MADSVETLGVHLRTRVKRLGEKKCNVRFSLIKKNSLPKELHESWGSRRC